MARGGRARFPFFGDGLGCFLSALLSIGQRLARDPGRLLELRAAARAPVGPAGVFLRALAPAGTDLAGEPTPEAGFFAVLDCAEEDFFAALFARAPAAFGFDGMRAAFEFLDLLDAARTSFVDLVDPARAAFVDLVGAALFDFSDLADPGRAAFAGLVGAAPFGFADLLEPPLADFVELGRAALELRRPSARARRVESSRVPEFAFFANRASEEESESWRGVVLLSVNALESCAPAPALPFAFDGRARRGSFAFFLGGAAAAAARDFALRCAAIRLK